MSEIKICYGVFYQRKDMVVTSININATTSKEAIEIAHKTLRGLNILYAKEL